MDSHLWISKPNWPEICTSYGIDCPREAISRQRFDGSTLPKATGGKRTLGIPTVADRIAQEVVRRYLEPLLEPAFHKDSYGYRPGRSAIDAVRTTRRRCWRADWVIDLDINAFFDTIDHELLLKAVRRHTDCRRALLYIERWLMAPMLETDGTLQPRVMGTPQGGVISPLLANLFLHYVFDKWMDRTLPHVSLERCADDTPRYSALGFAATQRQAAR